MKEKIQKIFFALSTRERISFAVALCALLISGIASSLIVIGNNTHIAPAPGGEHTEGFVGQPTYVNPVLATTEADKMLLRLLFSSLPDVAEKIENDPKDHTLWRVRLHDHLLWQDGEKLTSDDVIFTIQKIQDPESHSPLFQSWQGVRPERLSELELQLRTITPYAFFPFTLKHLYIVPKHLFTETPPANWRLSDFNLKPVGSGPYQFEALEKDRNGFIGAYHLKANPHYAGRPPYIPTFTVRFFPNTDDAVRSFNAGEISGLAGVEPDDLNAIKRPHKTTDFELPSYYAVFFNQEKNPILKDQNVREALALSTNRNELIQNVFNGEARPIKTPILVLTNEPNATSSRVEMITAANQLLEKSGWKIGGDGIRIKNMGKGSSTKLTLTMTVPQITFLLKTAQLLEREWRDVGITLVILPRPPEEINADAIKNRNYEMLVFGNVLSESGDLYSFWHSSGKLFPGFNLSLYDNKTADNLIEMIRQDFDKNDQKNKTNKLAALFEDNVPAVFLYSPNYLYLTSKNLEGIQGRFIGEPADRFFGIEGWYIKTARVLK